MGPEVPGISSRGREVPWRRHGHVCKKEEGTGTRQGDLTPGEQSLAETEAESPHALCKLCTEVLHACLQAGGSVLTWGLTSPRVG